MSIVSYEIINKVHKLFKVVFLGVLITLDVMLLFILPSVGKMLVYVIIFHMGTKLRMNYKLAIIAIGINTLLWMILVIVLDYIDISNEGSRGLSLFSMMIMTVCGSLIIPSIVFIVLRYLERIKIRFSRMKYILNSICEKTQLIYFIQFIVIMVFDKINIRTNRVLDYSVAGSLLYAIVVFGLSILASICVLHVQLIKKVLLQPIDVIHKYD